MPFKTIIPSGAKKKSTLVAEQLLAAINSGQFGQDQRLPSERKIAATMGVSRPPVREAISALQLVGLVESITGDGTYVRKGRDAQGPGREALEVLEANPSPFEVMQARIPLEMSIVEMACKRIDAEDVQAIEAVLEAMENAISRKDIVSYFQSNRRFHMGLAAASHNVVMERFLDYIFECNDNRLWEETVLKYIKDIEHVRRYVAEHRSILQAVAGNHVTAAKRLIKNHFKHSVQEVRDYL